MIKGDFGRDIIYVSGIDKNSLPIEIVQATTILKGSWIGYSTEWLDHRRRPLPCKLIKSNPDSPILLPSSFRPLNILISDAYLVAFGKTPYESAFLTSGCV